MHVVTLGHVIVGCILVSVESSSCLAELPNDIGSLICLGLMIDAHIALIASNAAPENFRVKSVLHC